MKFMHLVFDNNFLDLLFQDIQIANLKLQVYVET